MVTYAGSQSKHLVAFFPFRYAFSGFDDVTGELDSQDLRRAWRKWILALALHDIHPVETESLDLIEAVSRELRGDLASMLISELESSPLRALGQHLE